MNKCNDDDDYDTEQYLIRQKQIKELQKQYQSKRQELEKYLKTEESPTSSQLFTYETNYSTNQQYFQKSPLNIKNDEYINQEENYATISSNSKKNTNSLQQQNIMINEKKNVIKKEKSPQKLLLHNNMGNQKKNIIPIKKINKETQTQLTLSCKINQNTKFIVTLLNENDETLEKSTQTNIELKPKKIINQIQKQPVTNKFAQRFKTEYNLNIQQKQVEQNSIKKLKTKHHFEKWYQEQKQWSQKNQTKHFQMRMEKELQEYESQTWNYSPRILKISEDIVKNKFQGCDFIDRQQQYDNYLKIKQQNRQQDEINERKSKRFQMSPISRQIIRSVTPKQYRDYSTGHTANTSWFCQHQQ